MKIYSIEEKNENPSITKVYAKVNINGVKRYYSFYPKKILMVDEREKNLSYTVIYGQLPINYDPKNYSHFTDLDSIVFSKIQTQFENIKYSHLRNPNNAKGYIIEINYYHGFPATRSFKPL